MSFSRGNAGELLNRGMAAAQSGNPQDWQEAEFYLEWVLRTDADMDQQTQAWYWLSRVTDDLAKRKEYLENVLAIHPTHPDARRDRAILEGRLNPTEMRANPLAQGTPVDQSSEVPAKETRRFRCPKCGASTSYDPNTGMLRCQFCGTQIDEQGQEIEQSATTGLVGAAGVSEQDWVAAIYTDQGHRWALPQDRVLRCQGCGATVTFASSLASARCSYCSSPYAVHAAEEDLRQPDGVIRFSGEAAEASTQAQKWLAKQAARLGIPDDLPSMSALQSPAPIYLPFWTFDMGGEVQWSGWVRADMEIGGIGLGGLDDVAGLGGMAVGVLTGNFDIAASGAGNMAARHYDKSNMVHTTGSAGILLDDVLIPATTSIPAEKLAKLQYSTDQAVPYTEDILAGWPAEVYSVSMSDASLQAREHAMKEANEQVALQTGQMARGLSPSLQVSLAGVAVISYKLLLLPVWVVEYTYRKQAYRLFVNGQTGQIEGDVPRSGNPISRILGRQ